MILRNNSLTCFDKVYGEGIFEKVKLHAEYTQIKKNYCTDKVYTYKNKVIKYIGRLKNQLAHINIMICRQPGIKLDLMNWELGSQGSVLAFSAAVCDSGQVTISLGLGICI